MKQRLPLLLAWLFLAVAAWAKPEPFTAATQLSKEQSVYGFGAGRWAVESRGEVYLVEGRGRLSTSGGRSARLPLDQHGFISHRLYTYSRADQLLFWYEESDLDSAGGRMVCFDANTLCLRWKTSIPAFNIGQPLVDGDVAYVTGYGTAAKIDLSQGRVTWMIENLGKEQGGIITSFFLPEVRGPRLRLQAADYSDQEIPFKGKVIEPGLVELDRRSGNVLSVRATTYQSRR